MKDDPTGAGLELLYDVEAASLPTEIAGRFVRLSLGEEGEDYLKRVLSTRPGSAKTALHRFLRTWVMSDFDANGLLGMYPMHLLGTTQWEALLGKTPATKHLDVGAGSGDVTRTLSPLATRTVTTERSRAMARNLRRRGFECHEMDVAEVGAPDGGYDLITCLNVLDRCKRPRELLRRLVEALEPGGRLVVATPLPFDPFFYDGPRSLEPAEKLELPRQGWEPSVAALIERELRPLGLEIDSVSRVPYLCQGDSQRSLYVLDDALVVCRRPASTRIP